MARGIERALTQKFIQSLLKKPLKLFKGVRGWWVRLRTGKAIFIKESQVKKSLLKKGSSVTTSSKGSYSIEQASHIEAHFNSIKNIIKKELKADANTTGIIKGKFDDNISGQFHYKTGKIELEANTYDILTGFMSKKWWDNEWKSFNRTPLETLEQYHLFAVRNNTKIWSSYVDSVNTLLHESIHSVNWTPTFSKEFANSAVVNIEEGLTTYFSNKYTYQTILNTTKLPPSHLDIIGDVNINILPSYSASTKFMYQSAHLIRPENPHRFLVELKNMDPVKRLDYLAEELTTVSDSYPQVEGTVFEIVDKIYSSKGLTYDVLSLSHDFDDTIERGVLKEGIKKGLAALQSLLKRPLQWFQGIRGWWIRTRNGRAVFIKEAQVVDPLEVTVKAIRWGKERDKSIYQKLFGDKSPRELIRNISPPGMNVISDIDVDGNLLKVFIRNEENTFRMLRGFEFDRNFKFTRVHHSGLYNEVSEISHIIGYKKTLKYLQSLGWSVKEINEFMLASKQSVKLGGDQIEIPSQLKLIKEDVVYSTNNFKSLLRKQFELYDKLGISEIRLRAVSEGMGKDTFGGYVWAKYGFDFADGAERTEITQQFKNYLYELAVENKFSTINFKPPSKEVIESIKVVTPRDIANWTFSTERVLEVAKGKPGDFWYTPEVIEQGNVPYGKMFLLETAWEGKLTLTPKNNPQRIIFEEYIGYSKGGK